jgi:uncharacterized protein YuzE
MIKTSYDPEADALTLRFGPDGAYLESDFDAKGHVIGIEVLDVGLRSAGRYAAPARKRAAAE